MMRLSVDGFKSIQKFEKYNINNVKGNISFNVKGGFISINKDNQLAKIV